METVAKLAILADAAKYDASCASSGGKKRSAGPKGIGSVTGSGICHSYAPDGRCISLLKILLTNFCVYDCAYCINRRSSNVPRARFSVDEVVKLTLDFYRRNYIEGLFLSSGIVRSPDYTMEEMVRVARTLRQEHGYRGYIHLKTIPNADPQILDEAGRWADRLSVNVELVDDQGLSDYAPEKQSQDIRAAMARLRLNIDAAEGEGPRAPSFSPAGQSTQIIVGADGASDRTILNTSARLYGTYRLRRVYYSAFSPIPDSKAALPAKAAPLMREHRLYQADWMTRFYGFEPDEIQVGSDGMLDLEVDPKRAWALAHRERFPVDVNRADREMLLRVPGLGPKSVQHILVARRLKRLRLEDVARVCGSARTVRPFIVTDDWRPVRLADAEILETLRAKPATQLELAL